MSYQDSPRYQRYIQRLQAMRPEQRAIMRTAEVDEAFAGADMRKQLELRRMATEKQAGERGLGLRQEQFRHLKGQDRMSNVLGAASIGVNSYQGWQERKQANEMAKRYDAMAGLYQLPPPQKRMIGINPITIGS